MRYDNQKILRDENGTRYLNRIEYPVIPVRDTDLFIQGQYGKRLDNLAFEYYGDTQLWWISQEQILPTNQMVAPYI